MSVCAYCGKRRAVNRDHVVPKSYRRKAAIHPVLAGTVGSCFECNNLKGTRRLIPASWADRLTLLTQEFPGTPWRIWDGDTKSPAYRETHLSRAGNGAAITPPVRDEAIVSP